MQPFRLRRKSHWKPKGLTVSLESTQLIQNCTWNITKQNYRFKSPFSSGMKRNLFSLNWYLQNYSVKGKQSWLIFSCRKTVQADAIFLLFFLLLSGGGKGQIKFYLTLFSKASYANDIKLKEAKLKRSSINFVKS